MDGIMFQKIEKIILSEEFKRALREWLDEELQVRADKTSFDASMAACWEALERAKNA